jgi:hypothetical protein
VPKKTPGYHNIHLRMEEDLFRTLQEYCTAGVERLTATALLNYLAKTYVQDHIRPRMEVGESATWKAAQTDIPSVAAKVAHTVEPSAFTETGEVRSDD